MRLEILILAFLSGPVFAQEPAPPGDFHGWLNQGIDEAAVGRNDEAETSFRQAIALRPSDVSAHLYLAVLRMWRLIPANESEHSETAREAKAEFQWVLDHDPFNTTALGSLASLRYAAAQGVPDVEERLFKLDQVAALYVRLINADPRIKEAYYVLAVIDWTKWYRAWFDVRTELKRSIGETGPLPSPAREQLQRGYADSLTTVSRILKKPFKLIPSMQMQLRT